MTKRWMRGFSAMGVCAALLVSPPLTVAADEPRLFHVPADLFAMGGPLGSFELDACRIILADGPLGSLLRVSPAMAGLGFRDILFTVAPLEREVAFGPVAVTVRLRIPGRDPGDPTTTIQSTRVSTRIVGASVELAAVFERQGPEMTGEYYGLDPRTGKNGWVHALDVEADDLMVAVSFPIQAQGVALSLGAPTVTADFSFAVSAGGGGSVMLDGTFAKDMVKSAIEGAVANALNLEAYRAPLAAAITNWLREGPFMGLQLREIRLQPAADGGLDIQALTTADP